MSKFGSYAYESAIFIGRFQPLHIGHLKNILRGLEVAYQVIILVGSSNCIPDTKNPFIYEKRKHMILKDLEYINIPINRIIIRPIADYYEKNKWIKNTTNTILGLCGSQKICIIGHKKDRSSYYLKCFKAWDYIPVNKHKNLDAVTFRYFYFKYNIILTSHLISKDPYKGTFKELISFFSSPIFWMIKNQF